MSFVFAEADFAEDAAVPKEVWTVHGEKGTGKTTFVCGFAGTKAILSYDRKSKRVRDRLFAGDLTIYVWDAAKFYRGLAKEGMPEAGARSIAFIAELLNRLPEVDWVVHDSIEALIECAEMMMRHEHQLGPFQGVDLNLWKDRKATLRMVHGLSMARANKGVVYVTHSEEDKLVEEGRLIRQSHKPRWVDIIISETDNVVRTEMRQSPDGTRFVAVMHTIKVGPWQSGSVLDVTDRTLVDATAELKGRAGKAEAAVEELFG